MTNQDNDDAELFAKKICKVVGWQYSRGWAYERTGDKANITHKLNELLALFHTELAKREAEAEEKGYKRGYNTGWVKCGRSHDARRLTKAAEQLELQAKLLREAAQLQATSKEYHA